jgi:hypothetical protein
MNRSLAQTWAGAGFLKNLPMRVEPGFLGGMPERVGPRFWGTGPEGSGIFKAVYWIRSGASLKEREKSIASRIEHFQNMMSKSVFYFIVSWDGLAHLCSGVLVPIVFSPMANQSASQAI